VEEVVAVSGAAREGGYQAKEVGAGMARAV